MKVELMDITPHAEEKVANYAAICYDSDTSMEANARRVKHLMKVGHLATLRFAYATFKVSGISRVCSHQLVRHPHLSYLQRSQRYVNEDTVNYVVPPSLKGIPLVEQELTRANRIYRILTEIPNVKKEDARFVLPNATVTEMYVTGNLQAWKEACELRTSPKAQWEIRKVFTEIQDQLRVECPNIFRELTLRS